ncbi:MAG: bifunctional [glutamate--ammonia ligase]-adenylyl-L-tyrosine phosphorylase/[glutamate--ammonia-ligase] adenylyltransferase [Xanthomonadales bacterium]|nr:bifunctional [glutamate--ammonia ligase]-adenylyl-L-tyrosine phosphorylase/[glutamate--ammonia-ligase] adenylyltransferase [Xanthomonadales bacterium]
MSEREPPAAIDTLIERRLATLRELGCAAPATLDSGQLRRLLLVSDYAFERLRRDPATINSLGKTPAAPGIDALLSADGLDALRRYRHALSLDILWREVGSATLEETLAASTRQAECCIQLALTAAEKAIAERHGWLRNEKGEPRRLCVFALGKLGGAELNFSSDIDLVFGYAGGATGSSDGARPLDAETWFLRLGQRLIQLLGDVTSEGFAFRVDMRLRPFGKAGRLALSFSAMEQYFQREGRDWERYAWIKARPVAGDIAGGEIFLDTLRPFIYRRYLDYTAFEGLREMKALIAAEVKRRDLADHVKLGPGGIREIEFVVQLLQLIRAGREPELRQRSLMPALAALRRRRYLDADTARQLLDAYRFLRRLENRLQMLRDEQTHELPDDEASRSRLAAGLGFDGWSALMAALQRHRQAVSACFDDVFDAPAPLSERAEQIAAYWRRIEEADAASLLAAAGFRNADTLHQRLTQFARATDRAGLSARGRGRLDRVLPDVLDRIARSVDPATSLERVLDLLQAVLRRSSYLALLAEQPDALIRVVDVMASSALLAKRIAAHPLLLDDLLDHRHNRENNDDDLRVELTAELERSLGSARGDDIESQLLAFNEFQQSASFRFGMDRLFDRRSPADCARGLALIAELIVRRLLPLAEADVRRRHGSLPGSSNTDSGLLLIAYGSFGGAELGFESDLDLVFLYDGVQSSETSDGERPLDAPSWFVRVTQRVVSLLGTLTPAGKLYDVDLRLRPDGAKGLLVSTLQSFADYQRSRAWTWEHQALVRARCIAGSRRVAEAFECIRADILGARRDPDELRRDIATMRQRMRGELDRSRDDAIDLKHGRGGLVDLEFLLQGIVLRDAHAHPGLLEHRSSHDLITACRDAGSLSTTDANTLSDAHQRLLAQAQACTLDARPRVQPADAETSVATEQVRRMAGAFDLYVEDQ